MELTFGALRRTSLERAKVWHPRGINDWSLSDWGVAAAGEMGEALNIIKKLNRFRDNMVGNAEDATLLNQKLADEIADTVIYLDILAARIGIDLGAAVVSKFNRTSEKNGFPQRLLAGGDDAQA